MVLYRDHAKDQNALPVRTSDFTLARVQSGYHRINVLLEWEGLPVNQTKRAPPV